MNDTHLRSPSNTFNFQEYNSWTLKTTFRHFFRFGIYDLPPKAWIPIPSATPQQLWSVDLEDFPSQRLCFLGHLRHPLCAAQGRLAVEKIPTNKCLVFWPFHVFCVFFFRCFFHLQGLVLCIFSVELRPRSGGCLEPMTFSMKKNIEKHSNNQISTLRSSGCTTLPEATGSRCSMLGMYFRKCCLAKLGTFGKGVCRFRRVKENMPGKHKRRGGRKQHCLRLHRQIKAWRCNIFRSYVHLLKGVSKVTIERLWATYYSINFLLTQVKHQILINDMFQPFVLLKPSQPGLQTTSNYSS